MHPDSNSTVPERLYHRSIASDTTESSIHRCNHSKSIGRLSPRAGIPRVATSAPMYRRSLRATAPARWNHRQIALGTKGFQLSALSASALGTPLFGPHSPLL